MRVLHGVTGAANQPSTVSRLQREIGIDARCVSVSSGGFGYKADIELEVGADAQVSYSEFLRDAVDDYDVFHFYFRSFFFFDPRNLAFPSGLDLLLLRAAGKTVVVHYRGSEVREASKFVEFSPYNYVAENPSGIFSKFANPTLTQRMEYVASVANVVLVPDEELQSYVPGSRIVRRAIDLEDLAPGDRVDNDRPLVIHAPSRRVVKGTHFVLDAVEQLRSEGVDFDFRLIENLPHDEAKELYARADIIIDQLRIGWFGVFALEGMALGKCVMAFVRDDLVPALGDEPPLCLTSPPTLADDLRKVIGSRDLRDTVGKRGRAYVEEHHDARSISRELVDMYQEPEVADAKIDVGGVLDFLLVQRADTKNTFRKKYVSAAPLRNPKGMSDFAAEFRRTRVRYGFKAAVERTAKWGVRRTRSYIGRLR